MPSQAADIPMKRFHVLQKCCIAFLLQTAAASRN
jgi:hypothetical protein